MPAILKRPHAFVAELARPDDQRPRRPWPTRRLAEPARQVRADPETAACAVRKFAYMRSEPHGATDNPEIPHAHSIRDYVARWLASRFLDVGAQDELGVVTAEVKRRRAAALDGGGTASAAAQRAMPDTGPPCTQCGAGFMIRTDTCLTCSTCGHNTGCG